MKRAWLILFAFGVLSSASFAQEKRRVTWQDRQVLDERDREELHEGSDPFHIVGLEQGDNDFRSRTPGLAATDGEVLFVDEEELRQRQIAMLTGGSVFRRAPHSLGRGPAENGGWKPSAVAPEQGGEECVEEIPVEQEDESLWIIAACALGAGGAALALKKLLM